VPSGGQVRRVGDVDLGDRLGEVRRVVGDEAVGTGQDRAAPRIAPQSGVDDTDPPAGEACAAGTDGLGGVVAAVASPDGRSLYTVGVTDDAVTEFARGPSRSSFHSGAMSSWYIVSSLGFFPNSGQDIYYLVGPLFTKSSITIGEGKTITIEAQNASKTNLYIQSCKINGVEWTKTWFSHSDIKGGANIHFVSGETTC